MDWFSLACVIIGAILLFGPFLADAYDEYQDDQKETACIQAHGTWTKNHCAFDSTP